MKKYLIEVELQSSELILGLRKTAMIVTCAVCNKVVFVKYCPDFKVFSRSHKRSVKNHFSGNIPHQWRFQYFKEMKKYNFGVELQSRELNLC